MLNNWAFQKAMRGHEAFDRVFGGYEKAERFLREFRAVSPGREGRLPDVAGASIEHFYGAVSPSQSSTVGWKPWPVPKNATMCMLICQGGAGGGGGGLTGATSTGRGGGGGGGSGAIGKILIPAVFLPKQLYILPGTGGKGSASGSTGIAGQRSFVGISPGSVIAGNIILISGSVAAGGGVAGTTAGAQAGGAAETVGSFAVGAYQHFGIWTGAAGQAGSAAGALGAGGASVTWGGAGITTAGGTGGGSASTTNTDGAGGAFNGSGVVPSFNSAAVATAGFQGVHGESPWFSTSGGGGGSSSTGTGGLGGNGAWGSGGGGGGGGITGGNGGDGGPGLITIVWW